MTKVSPFEASQLRPVQFNDSIISARHLTKKFGAETAVNDISFTVMLNGLQENEDHYF